MARPFPSPTSKWHSKTYPSISPTRAELSARGKTVVVTGGGTGIGAETARSFASAGASRIALLGRRLQPLLDTKASIEQQFVGAVDVLIMSTNVANKSEVDAAFSKIVSDGDIPATGDGKIHVLVNAAGMIGPQDSVEEVDSEGFRQAMEINLMGSLYVAQAFLRYAATDAVAIDVNSASAIVHSAGFAAYSVAKLAVYRLWDHLAFANPGLSIFHIQPGIVDTAMNREVGAIAAMGYEDHGKRKGYYLDETMKESDLDFDFSFFAIELQRLACKPRSAVFER